MTTLTETQYALEEEFNEDLSFPPGTIRLVDLEHNLRTRHGTGALDTVVLVPAPSTNPEDPLNWTPHRKLLATICTCVFTLFVGIANSAVYSVLVPLSINMGLSGI